MINFIHWSIEVELWNKNEVTPLHKSLYNGFQIHVCITPYYNLWFKKYGVTIIISGYPNIISHYKFFNMYYVL